MERLAQATRRGRGNGWRTASAVLALSALVPWTPREAAAESGVSQLLACSVMTGLFMEVGKAECSGGRGNPGMPVATAFRHQERQGIVTSTRTAIAICN